MRALWTLRRLNGPVINSALICCWTPSLDGDEFRQCEGKLRLNGLLFPLGLSDASPN